MRGRTSSPAFAEATAGTRRRANDPPRAACPLTKISFLIYTKNELDSQLVNATAEAEVKSLPPDMIAHFLRLGDMIAASGVMSLREPYAKHLSGKLWELRLKGRDGIARAIYVTASGQRVIVLRTFIKKTEKTPPRELDIAAARMKEIRE